MGSRHILAIPYPAQGHVIPLLEFSPHLAKQGFEITFVNTEHNHKRVMGALAETDHIGDANIHLVSLTDGMEPGANRNELGILLKSEEIKLAPSVPTTRTESLPWACFGNEETQKSIFQACLRNKKAVEVADWLICNTVYELGVRVFILAPHIHQIGPLLASNRLGNSGQKDSTCLKWLDQQSPCSVTYVAFGSFTVLDKTLLRELVLGFELTGKPFLVVRPDLTTENPNNVFPLGFQERIESRGKIVCWAPQQRVLNHPSIACFVSHCGWNSTLESLSNGVRFLCWPYFADQFLNENYICVIWKVGLRSKKDEHGIVTRTEIKKKVEKLLADEDLKQRIQKRKKTMSESVEEGGRSYKISTISLIG
ncbi:UDP-glycosyltransferase 83A1-like [Benincasa hispida]|uniref:UDP-glycosyltransferase 83A1-like n=1 Tax=Benincasa hispida TaxID=102211 RepID=UPI0018FFDAC8|nr:UDP-glycosyltransferase 83A1-like [Benincasa hispida]